MYGGNARSLHTCEKSLNASSDIELFNVDEFRSKKKAHSGDGKT
jgi:hypothetical protein